MLDIIKTLGTNIVRIAAIVIVGFIGLVEPMQMVLNSETTLRNDFFQNEDEEVVEDSWDLWGDEEQSASGGIIAEGDNQETINNMMSEGGGTAGEKEQKVLIVSPTATPAEEFTYVSYEEYIVIEAYNGTRSNVEIPNVIEGLPVTEIGTSAFSENGTLERVIIPETVTHIRDSAFSDCKNLLYVDPSVNIEEIGYYAFSGCSSLREFDFCKIMSEEFSVETGAFSGSGLQSVVIPSNWLYIGEVFADCQALTRVTFEKRGELAAGKTGEISTNAFLNTGITEITIPGYYTEVAAAFGGCKNLTKFVWEESEDGTASQKLWAYTFDGCDSLTEIYLSGTVGDVSLALSGDWGNVTVYAPMDSPAWQAALEEGITVQEE